MNIFKSVFSDDPDDENQSSDPESLAEEPQKQRKDGDPEPDSSSSQPHSSRDHNSPGTDGTGWSFGGLLKTLSTRSESVLETYRRDLREFGSGLKNETAAFQEVASRTAKDLPASIEVAQGSLDTVRHAIDELGNSLWKSTAEVVSQGKGSLLASDVEYDSSQNSSASYGGHISDPKQKISRFGARMRATLSDSRTYCDEPEDSDDYVNWKLGFVLEEKGEEVERLLSENAAIGNVYREVVPNVVDHETFWSRYFYNIHRLKQAEDARANLVKRAILKEDDEDLRWDDDDEGEEEVGTSDSTQNAARKDVEEEASERADPLVKEKGDSVQNDAPRIKNSSQTVEECTGKEEVRSGSAAAVHNNGENGPRETHGVTVVAGRKSDAGSEERMLARRESSEDSDVSVVPIQPPVPDEDDLEWDEIEELGSNDEERASSGGGGQNRSDLRKRLSVAEEEEDLTWDIDDEDEPVKA